MSKLVIFDMDGVLLNSEEIYFNMNQRFFRSLGAVVSIEEHQTFVGISATKMWAYLKEKYGLPQSVETLKLMERELKYHTLNETELVPTEGIRRFMDFLVQQGCTLAIASSSLRKNIELILGKLGLDAYFDHIVAGEDVVNGKPDPDIFLKVADHYRVDPAKCIVIEDSTNGVLAAKAAGMYCVGYINPGSGNQDLSSADLLIDSFDDDSLYSQLPLHHSLPHAE